MQVTRTVETRVIHVNGVPRVTHIQHTRWTPESHGNTPIRSTWRDATGKPLTDRAIRRHERDGWYGESKQKQARKLAAHKDGFVLRCVCGSENTRFYNYAYLEKSGYYCAHCVAEARVARDKEVTLRRLYMESLQKEYE